MHTAPKPATGTLVLAPVSPAIAKLLHKLQAQIISEAAERAAPVESFSGTLAAPIARSDYSDRFTYRGANGSDEFARNRFCPDLWHDSLIDWHPSHWRQYSYRTDTAGRMWVHTGGSIAYVTDDFGSLVPVGGAE